MSCLLSRKVLCNHPCLKPIHFVMLSGLSSREDADINYKKAINLRSRPKPRRKVDSSELNGHAKGQVVGCTGHLHLIRGKGGKA
jgi:hypothetical protein